MYNINQARLNTEKACASYKLQALDLVKTIDKGIEQESLKGNQKYTLHSPLIENPIIYQYLIKWYSDAGYHAMCQFDWIKITW